MSQSNEELQFHSFATIPALKGNQFGKEVFTAMLTFKELKKFLQVFPEVQRATNGRKIGSIKRYILSGLEENQVRFFSSLTASVRGDIFYDELQKRIAVDTIESKLSINDGQHRFYSVSEAIDDLKKRIESKHTSQEDKLGLQRKINILEDMTIPIMIFNDISISDEKQLFYDLNNLSTKPTRSATIRLAQSDLLSKLARELSEENEFLTHYGVEFNKGTIHPNNSNTVLLTTVYECSKIYVRNNLGSLEYLTKHNYSEVKDEISEIYNQLFEALPRDLDVKGKYIITKGFALRGMFMFIVKQNLSRVPSELIYQAIKNTDWTESESTWGSYGAIKQRNGSLLFSGNNTGGLAAVQRMLEIHLDDLRSKQIQLFI